MRNSIVYFTKAVKDTNSIEVTSIIHDVVGLETQMRDKVVYRAALNMSQNIMLGFKSNQQVNYKPKSHSAAFRPPHA